MQKTLKIILFMLFFLLFLMVITVSAKAWWSPDYTEYVPISVDSSKVTSNLYDFPVLVVINSTVGAKCDDGNSIRFLDTDNTTLLEYEVERWNSSGDSFVWVKVPFVSSATDSLFLMYYNNSNVTTAQNPTQVWTHNYTAVWHFNESSGTIYDSTSNDYDLSAVNNPTYVTDSKIAGAWSFDGVNQYLNLPSLSPDDTGTMSFWTKRGCSSCGRRRFAGATDEYEVVVRGDNIVTNHLWVSGAGILTSAAFTDTTSYHHLQFTYNNNTNLNTIYFNDTLTASGFLADDFPGANINFQIAHSAWFAGEYYNGIIDEFRISNKDRNGSWLNATFFSNNNSLLYFGAYEGQLPYQLYPYPSNGSMNVTDGVHWSNETYWFVTTNGTAPVIYELYPANASTGICFVVSLGVRIGDADACEFLNITWYSNATGTWQVFGTNHTMLPVCDSGYGKFYYKIAPVMDLYNTTYSWYVNVTDGIFYVESPIYTLTTAPDPVYCKQKGSYATGLIGLFGIIGILGYIWWRRRYREEKRYRRILHGEEWEKRKWGR